MSLPPFLVGTALVFWGWHIGLWWLGLPLALLAELPRFLGWRWQLDLRERQRVADLVSLLLVLAGVYLYLTQPRLGNALILLVQWAPALLFPVLALQLYGERGGVERAVLMLSLRGGRPGGEELIDLAPAYLLTCLLASAMLPPPGAYYYPLLTFLAAWALWPLRSHKGRPWAWGLVLLSAAGVGHVIGVGLQQAQVRLEDMAVEWLSGWLGGDLDPYRVTTAIGEVGWLKQSERIVLRVYLDRSLDRPLLLRSASYDRYLNGTWLANATPFKPLVLKAGGWPLPGDAAASDEVRVFMDLKGGKGILPLPAGSRIIEGLQGARLSRNGSGAVKVVEGPAVAAYRVLYGGPSAAAPPGETDLRIPPNERRALAQVVDELGLEGLPAARVLGHLEHWFGRFFRYTLRLEAPPRGRSALSDFLLERRAGHCEYFASAAVLLLRRIGIPARYVRGWSVQEYSALEDAYLARARHAHAWVLAWVDGEWRDFDPTPPVWSMLEADDRPWWGPIQDLWARLGFLLARKEGDAGEGQVWLAALLLPLTGILAWRIARRGRRHVRRTGRATRTGGAASVFTPVEQALERRDRGRHPGETLRHWVSRLDREGEPAVAELIPALDLYYRRQFDPRGLAPGQDAELDCLIGHWLQHHGAGTTPHLRRGAGGAG
ncbi:MAG: transglutaminase domain-containing protein [Chromatiaceae bacterium]